MNENKDILACKYLKTLGDPLSAVKRGLAEIEREAGGGIEMAGVGVTGSGRYMIGEYLGADVIKDEITAQARAAITMDPGVDTVFEIGGQDSKYISIRNGAVESFQMNKICAAGTGCFIEEVSRKFRIPLDDFSSLALSSDSPLYLGDGCTVFIEAAIAAHISRGVRLEDIASGLCYSIVRNYLDRVVGQRKIGNRVLFQGGVAYNQGVINAFRALTEKEITVPPFFSVTGAYGAALLAHEEMKDGVTLSRGFDPHPAVIESGGPGVKDICDLETATSFSRQVEEVVFRDYDGIVDRGKKTVGIPRTLFTYGMFPFFNAFFRELGLNVLLSHPTCEETISLGQEYSLDEACFPLKLINGHVASLMAEPVDYIFFPDMFSVNHPGSEARRNYGCSYMQLAFKVVNQAMELDRKGIRLLSPTIAFSLGRDFMIRSFAGTGEILGKTPEESARALQKGLEAVSDYEKRIGEKGRSILKEAGLSEKVFVIVSKIYGVADPVLNMGVPDMLMEMGHRVLPFYMLPPENIFRDTPTCTGPSGSIYWSRPIW
jgi:predicted CoA-substrate-specific enzyme activase